MQFIQFKLPARLEADSLVFPKGWVRTKHQPHVTFFEIQVASSIVDQVVAWIKERAQEIEALVATLCFDKWTVFYKRKFNIAVLAPSHGFEDIDSRTAASSPVVTTRCTLMKELFAYFGCGQAVETSVEGLPVYLYYRDAQLLFSCNLYQRPEAWYPHVSVAIKFQHLQIQENPSEWAKAKATTSRGLFHELLQK